LKALALSVVILNGTPNLAKILSSKNSLTIVYVVIFEVIASTHPVKQSMVVRIHLNPSLIFSLNSPMKSRPHYWKGASTTTDCKGKDMRCCFPVNSWHCWHNLTNLSTLPNFVSQYILPSRFYVLWFKKCDVHHGILCINLPLTSRPL
jgi:hypothetical protein